MRLLTDNKNIQFSIIQFIFLQQLLVISPVSAFFNFFQQEHHNNQQQHAVPYEEQYLDVDCNNYVCPYTKQCVASPRDCDCPFPSSQLKCILPETENNKNPGFICISKPAVVEDLDEEDEEDGSGKKESLAKIYDSVGKGKGASARVEGIRDCGWVVDAYLGKV